MKVINDAVLHCIEQQIDEAIEGIRKGIRFHNGDVSSNFKEAWTRLLEVKALLKLEHKWSPDVERIIDEVTIRWFSQGGEHYSMILPKMAEHRKKVSNKFGPVLEFVHNKCFNPND